MSGALSRIEKSWADYSADHRTAAEKEIIESLVPTLERVKRMTLAYGEQARAGSLRNVEAGTFNREMYGAFDPLGTALSTLIDLQLSEGAKLNEQMEKRYDSMRTTFLLIGAAALVLIVAAAWFISLSIMRPLSDLRGVIRRVQDSSNLTLRADARGRDEVRSLATNTHKATETIREMIEALQAGASSAVSVMQQSREQAQVSVQRAHEAGKALGLIAQAVEGIAQSNAQISTATEEQTATASEVSQNIDSLNASIGEVAEGAVKTSTSSVELAKLANGLEQQIQRFTV